MSENHSPECISFNGSVSFITADQWKLAAVNCFGVSVEKASVVICRAGTCLGPRFFGSTPPGARTEKANQVRTYMIARLNEG
mgnify:CR=1 FL=1|jgi:hypothetical protein